MDAFARPFARAFAAAAVAAACLVAQPTHAQAAEGERLGTELAGILFQAADLDALMAAELQKLGGTFDEMDGRPEWNDMFIEAAQEELAHDRPALERIVGREIGADFTLPELRAGVAFLKSPAGAAIIKAGVDKNAGRPVPPFSRAVEKEAERFLRTPEGRSFMEKFQNVDKMMEGAEIDFMAELVPGMMRRFGEKAEAAELARQAAR